MINQPDENIGKKISQVKKKCTGDMKTLVDRARNKFESKGFKVQVADTARQARDYIASLAELSSPVLLSGAGIDRELGLYDFLSARGYNVVDAGMASRALRILGLKPGHPVFPLYGYEENVILDKLKSHYGDGWKSLDHWQEEHYSLLAGAGVGVTGCAALVVEQGVVLIAEEIENAHIASALPPVHVVVVGFDKIVYSIEEALLVARGISMYGAGKPVCRNLFFIGGPSATADIQGLIVRGMHGPREVHVVLLDNGRTAAINSNRKDLLMCIECGSCLKSCQVYRRKGPVFPQEKEAPFNSCWALAKGGRNGDCLNCGQCVQACPLAINTLKK